MENKSNKNRITEIIRRPDLPALIAIILLSVVLSIVADSFLTLGNLQTILIQISIWGIVAMALNQVILAGEIDISVGSVIAFCAWVYGTASLHFDGIIVPLITCLVTGVVVGFINGVMVTKLRIPAMIATFGTQYVFRGIMLILISGPVLITSERSRIIASGDIVGIDIPIVLLFLAFAIFSVLSMHSTWGRNVMAVGGNRRAAQLIGLDIDGVCMKAFVLVGLCCGIASTILIGRIGQLQATAATGYELYIISSVAIGGTSMNGGRGTVFSPLVGVVLIGIIHNGMSILGIPGIYQDLVNGIIIMVAILLDSIREGVVNVRK